MIKTTMDPPNADHVPQGVMTEDDTSHGHPSPFLVVMNVISCFLVTLAFASSITQIASWIWYFIFPSMIGFFATIPYHTLLYKFARKHRDAPKNKPTLRLWYLVHAFLLITLWLVIFFINILFCAGTAPTTPVGVVVTTIASGIEWMVAAYIAIRLTYEYWKVEKFDFTEAEETFQTAEHEGYDEETLHPNSFSPPPSTPRYIYLLSYILASLALVFAINTTFICFVNVIAFFITAPCHITIFVSSRRPRLHSSFLSKPGGVICAFSLIVLWCFVVVVDILCYGPGFQKVLSAIFGSMECIIVGCIAIRCILDSLRPAEKRIQLPGSD